MMVLPSSDRMDPTSSEVDDGSQGSVELAVMADRASRTTERIPLLEAFVQAVGKILPWSACEVRLRSGPSDAGLSLVGLREGGDDSWKERVRELEEEGLIAWALTGGRPVSVPDLSDSQAPGWILVPLVVQESVAGCAIFTLTPRAPRMAGRKFETIRLLAVQAALALDNLVHIEEVRHGYGELRSLHQVAASLGRTLDLDRLFEIVCQALQERIQPHVVALGVFDDQGQPMRLLSVGAKPEECRGLLNRISRAEVTLRLEVGLRSGMDLESLGCRRAVGLPLVHGESGGLGALLVGDPDQASLQSPDALEWLESMSNLLAAAVDNARLYEELLKANRKLSDLQGSLVRTGRLAGIGQMAGGIAHEINNPLQVILGRVQILQVRAQDREDILRDLKRVEQETMRIAHIVRGLQDFARQEPGGAFSRVRLESIAEAVVDFLGHRFRRHNVEVVRTGDWTISVNGDPDQLKHLLLALCQNALQAMPQGGRLEMDLSAQGAVAILDVSDSGEGIAPEDFERMFDPFFSRHGGTGLGLAIAYSIAQRHGGGLQPVPGQTVGARMRLALPLNPG